MRCQDGCESLGAAPRDDIQRDHDQPPRDQGAYLRLGGKSCVVAEDYPRPPVSRFGLTIWQQLLLHEGHGRGMR